MPVFHVTHLRPAACSLAAALVSRRFCRVFHSEPALWRSLELNFQHALIEGEPLSAESDERIHGLLPLLQRVSGVLEQLSIGCHSGGLMAAVLACLQHSRLAALQVACGDGAPDWWDAPIQALSHLTAITRLELHCGQLPSCTAAVLSSLPRLSSLSVCSLTGKDVAPGVLAPALPRLARRLSHLELRFIELPHTVAFAIAALSQLGSLKLDGLRFRPELAGSLSRLAFAERIFMRFDARSPAAPVATDVLAAVLEGGYLPSLRSLQLSLNAIPPALLEAIAEQAQLTALELQGMLPGVQPLTQLQRLQRLSLCHAGQAPGVLELPLPSGFPALTALQLEAGRPSWNGNDPLVRWRHLQFAAMCSAASEVPLGLRLLQVAVGEARLFCCEDVPVGCEAWAFAHPIDLDGAPEAEPGELVLRVRGLRALPSLERLLDVLLRPDAPLHHLVLSRSELPPAALLGCSRIAALHSLGVETGSPSLLSVLPHEMPALRSLRLPSPGSAGDPIVQSSQLPAMPVLRQLELGRRIDSPGGSSLDATLPALIAQSPHLARLAVLGWRNRDAPEQLPAPSWLSELRGIQELSLPNNCLADLLAGPYLSSERGRLRVLLQLGSLLLSRCNTVACCATCNPCRHQDAQPGGQCL